MDGDKNVRNEDHAEVSVAFLALPQTSVGSLYASYEDFANIGRLRRGTVRAARFRTMIVTPEGAPFRTNSGALVTPDASFADAGAPDIVFAPALIDDGSFAEACSRPLFDPAVGAWLRDRSAAGSIVAGVCTGSFVLADAGLLDGEEATTHWLYMGDFARLFPAVRLVERRSIIVAGRDGRLVTGGSGVYMTDVNLHLISRFAGPAAAEEYARLFGKYWRGARAASRARDVDPPQVRDAAVAAAQAWMHENLGEADLVRSAASRVHLTERTFARRFRRATGQSAGAYARGRRIEQAIELLGSSRLSVDEIADRVGYADGRSLRRAFKDATGLSPASHRRLRKSPPE